MSEKFYYAIKAVNPIGTETFFSFMYAQIWFGSLGEAKIMLKRAKADWKGTEIKCSIVLLNISDSLEVEDD